MDDTFLAIEAVRSLIECNEAMCEVSTSESDLVPRRYHADYMIKVPEDLQSILNDSSTVFNGSADITTKEILKRYGDIARTPIPQHTVSNTQNSPSPRGGKGGRGNVPMATRVVIDPSQETAWQKEISVRHVTQGPGTNTYPSNSTPPQNHYDFSNPNSPYHQTGGSGHYRAGSSDSQRGSPSGDGGGGGGGGIHCHNASSNRNSQYSIGGGVAGGGWNSNNKQHGHQANELGVTGAG